MKNYFAALLIISYSISYAQPYEYKNINEYYQTYEIESLAKDEQFYKCVDLCNVVLLNEDYSEMRGLASCILSYINLKDEEKINKTIDMLSEDKKMVLWHNQKVKPYLDSLSIFNFDFNQKNINRYNKELAANYVLMYIEDQGRRSVETGAISVGPDATETIIRLDFEYLFKKARNMPNLELHKSNITKIDSLFKLYGEPDASEIGVIGMKGIYLTILHSQIQNLELYDSFIKNNYSSKRYGYLIDKQRVARGLAQLYGTQARFDRNLSRRVLYRTEDQGHIDCRRMKAKMEPIAVYTKLLGLDKEDVPKQHDCLCNHLDMP